MTETRCERLPNTYKSICDYQTLIRASVINSASYSAFRLAANPVNSTSLFSKSFSKNYLEGFVFRERAKALNYLQLQRFAFLFLVTFTFGKLFTRLAAELVGRFGHVEVQVRQKAVAVQLPGGGGEAMVQMKVLQILVSDRRLRRDGDMMDDLVVRELAGFTACAHVLDHLGWRSRATGGARSD